jgi:hypothetical protein
MGLSNDNKIVYVSIGFIAGWALRKASIIAALVIGLWLGAFTMGIALGYKETTQENRNVN